MSRYGQLISVLEETRGLLALPGNDFSWSSWKDAGAALAEIEGLLFDLRRDILPDTLILRALFAATGPIGEVSLSSGWADQYLKVSERFDAEIEKYV